jgi:glutathione S-transferase
MTMILYELGGREGLRYSQFAWRSHLALAHKGLDVEARPVRISDKNSIAFSNQNKVPILVSGSDVISDSWKIAEYLEAAYPDAPSLFGGEIGRSTTRFINAWVDRQLIPLAVPMLMVNVVDRVDDEDAAHLRRQIESAFLKPLEVLAEKRDHEVVAFRRLLDPARQLVRSQPFIAGQRPAYADYILFSLFQWARVVSRFQLLENGDALWSWRERMLDLYNGLARSEAAAGASAEARRQ